MKQTDLKGQQSFILLYSVYMWWTLQPLWLQAAFLGPYFPLKTACLFRYGKKSDFSISLIFFFFFLLYLHSYVGICLKRLVKMMSRKYRPGYPLSAIQICAGYIRGPETLAVDPRV